MPPLASPSPPTTSYPLRLLLWCLWLAGAAYMTAHHVMWRDEIRALSFAERGGNIAEMIVQIRGFGHPALWHVLLRGALFVYPHPIVLAVVAFLIGAAAAALLAFKAPFRPLFLALALFGATMTYEYVAVARNYGLSVLILFAVAAAWTRLRDRPGVIGALLFLLCNTNVHSVMLAGALLLFWLVELLQRPDQADRRRWASFLVAVLLVLASTALCLWQVYPPVDDAAMLPPDRSGPAGFVISLLVNVGPYFHELMPETLRTPLFVIGLLPILLILSIASLRRFPGALVAGVAALIGMALVFQVIYPGYYRHQGLLLAFLLTLTWIGQAKRPLPRSNALAVGRAAFMVLLALQCYSGVLVLTRVAGGVPESRSRDLAALLARPGLADAIVLGDPDTMLEPLPYYAANPIYMVREGRFGSTPTFSHAASSTMTIGRILSAARDLQARTGRPIVIVLGERLEPTTPAAERDRGYYGPLRLVPDEVRRFLAATSRIARFAPAVTDESYDVYVLNRAGPPAR